MDIGEGSILECVSTKQNEWIEAKSMRLTLGALYTVEHIIPQNMLFDHSTPCNVDGCSEPFIWLKGKGRRGIDQMCYCPSQFKPFGECEEVERDCEELVPVDA